MKRKIGLILFILIIPFIVINVDAKELTVDDIKQIFIDNTNEHIYLQQDYAYYIDNPIERYIELNNDANRILNNISSILQENDEQFDLNSIFIYYTQNDPEYKKYLCNFELDGVLIGTKETEVKYKDYENYNQESQEIIDSIFKESSMQYNYEIPLDKANILLTKEELLENYPIKTEIDTIIQESGISGISYKIDNVGFNNNNLFEANVNVDIYIFKDGVFYKKARLTYFYIAEINVPDEVEKTINDYVEYASNEVNKYLEGKSDKELTLEQMTADQMGYAHYYNILEEDHYINTNVAVVNNDKILLADYVEVDLETSKQMIFASTITETDNELTEYNSIVTYLNSLGYTNILRSYYFIGVNTSKTYFYLNNDLNGKTVKILINNASEGYTELNKVIENGMIILNIPISNEVFIAYKSEEKVITIEDLTKNISGYYSSNYTADNISAIKEEIEQIVLDEINQSGYDYKSLGYKISLENENNWYLKIIDKNNNVYKKVIYITAKPTNTQEVVSEPTKEHIKTNTVYRPVENKTTNIVEEKKQEEIIEKEKNKINKIETKPTIKKDSNKKTTPKNNTIKKEDKEKITISKEAIIKIVVGIIVIISLGGGVYYVRSRYY